MLPSMRQCAGLTPQPSGTTANLEGWKPGTEAQHPDPCASVRWEAQSDTCRGPCPGPQGTPRPAPGPGGGGLGNGNTA